MSKLSPQQSAAVAEWIRAGASLSEVQKRLQEAFGLTLTYMDVRLEVDDIGIQLADAPPAHFQQSTAAGRADFHPDADAASDADDGMGYADAPASATQPVAGKVTVALDRITRPGAVISGSVTFSDGVTAHWFIDQLGRLGMNRTPAGYQPTREDVVAFQQELRKLV
jgi:hypothetical protein